MRILFSQTKLFFALLVISLYGPLAWSYQAGFNELFITSYVLHQSSAVLNTYFGPHGLTGNYPGLAEPDAASLDFGTINYWVSTLAQSQESAVGKLNFVRDIIPLDYLAPDVPGCSYPGATSVSCYPFDSAIVGILTIYKTNNMNLLLAFGMNGAPAFQEPQWVKNDLKKYSGNAQMQRRMYDYAQIITNFLHRMYYNYGDTTWRQWFQNNVRLEPMNEFSSNISGYVSFAAYLDSQVKSQLSAKSVLIKRVVSSSIVSGTDSDYLNWYKGYYQSTGAQSDATPNIHLYYSSALDKGSFVNSTARFYKVVDALYNNLHSAVLIGEVGHSYLNSMIDSKDLKSKGEHNSLTSELASGINWYEVDTVAYWRLLGSNVSVNCYIYPTACGGSTATQTTFGMIHLSTSGNHYNSSPTTQCIEPQAVTWLHLPALPLCPN